MPTPNTIPTSINGFTKPQRKNVKHLSEDVQSSFDFHDICALGRFQLQNRRFLGNKYKLLDFIKDIVAGECQGFKVFCDIFAGTGVVGDSFNDKNVKVISNDILTCNYIPLRAFLSSTNVDLKKIEEKLDFLNSLISVKENYFSRHFGGTYFTTENARKIG